MILMLMPTIVGDAATHQRQGFREQQPMAKEKEEAKQEKALMRTSFKRLLLQTTVLHVLFPADAQKRNEHVKEQPEQRQPQECRNKITLPDSLYLTILACAQRFARHCWSHPLS